MKSRAWRRTKLTAVACLIWLTGCRSDERALLCTMEMAGKAWRGGDFTTFEPLVDHAALMNQLFAHYGEQASTNQHNVWPNLMARDSAAAEVVTRVARGSTDPYVGVLTRLHPMYRTSPRETLRVAVLRIANDSATVGVIGRLPGVESVDTLAFRLVRQPKGWRVVGFSNLDELAQRIAAHRQAAAPGALDR